MGSGSNSVSDHLDDAVDEPSSIDMNFGDSGAAKSESRFGIGSPPPEAATTFDNIKLDNVNLDDGAPKIDMTFGDSSAAKSESGFGIGGWSSGWGTSNKLDGDNARGSGATDQETKESSGFDFDFDAFKGSTKAEPEPHSAAEENPADGWDDWGGSAISTKKSKKSKKGAAVVEPVVDLFMGLSKSQKKKPQDKMKKDAKLKEEEDAKRKEEEDPSKEEPFVKYNLEPVFDLEPEPTKDDERNEGGDWGFSSIWGGKKKKKKKKKGKNGSETSAETGARHRGDFGMHRGDTPRLPTPKPIMSLSSSDDWKMSDSDEASQLRRSFHASSDPDTDFRRRSDDDDSSDSGLLPNYRRRVDAADVSGSEWDTDPRYRVYDPFPSRGTRFTGISENRYPGLRGAGNYRENYSIPMRRRRFPPPPPGHYPSQPYQSPQLSHPPPPLPGHHSEHPYQSTLGAPPPPPPPPGHHPRQPYQSPLGPPPPRPPPGAYPGQSWAPPPPDENTAFKCHPYRLPLGGDGYTIWSEVPIRISSENDRLKSNFMGTWPWPQKPGAGRIRSTATHLCYVAAAKRWCDAEGHHRLDLASVEEFETPMEEAAYQFRWLHVETDILDFDEFQTIALSTPNLSRDWKIVVLNLLTRVRKRAKTHDGNSWNTWVMRADSAELTMPKRHKTSLTAISTSFPYFAVGKKNSLHSASTHNFAGDGLFEWSIDRNFEQSFPRMVEDKDDAGFVYTAQVWSLLLDKSE
jgi:hypothetical protein